MKEIYKDAYHKANDLALYLEHAPLIMYNLDNLLELAYEYFRAVEPYYKEPFALENHEFNTVPFDVSLEYVREYLESISSEVLTEFDESFKNGLFTFLDMQDGTEKEESTFHCSFQKYEKKYDEAEFHSSIEIQLKGTIGDAATIIHEFFHYLNQPVNNRYTDTREMFTEGISIFFENDFLSYMINKNKDYLSDVGYLKLKRYDNTLTAATKLIDYLVVLNSYLEFGNINESTFSLLKEYHKLHPSTEKDFETLVKKFNKINHPNDITSTVSYVIGTVLATNPGRCKNIRERFLDINNSIRYNRDNINIFDYLEADLEAVDMVQPVVADIKINNLYMQTKNDENKHIK